MGILYATDDGDVLMAKLPQYRDNGSWGRYLYTCLAHGSHYACQLTITSIPVYIFVWYFFDWIGLLCFMLAYWIYTNTSNAAYDGSWRWHLSYYGGFYNYFSGYFPLIWVKSAEYLAEVEKRKVHVKGDSVIIEDMGGLEIHNPRVLYLGMPHGIFGAGPWQTMHASNEFGFRLQCGEFSKLPLSDAEEAAEDCYMKNDNKVDSTTAIDKTSLKQPWLTSIDNDEKSTIMESSLGLLQKNVIEKSSLPHLVPSVKFTKYKITDPAKYDWEKEYDPFAIGIVPHMFHAPICREVMLDCGCMSARKEAVSAMLKKESFVLIPGGAEEALVTSSGKFRLVLNDRFGCIKVAIEEGCSHISPFFVFGENERYTQSFNPYLRRFQIAVQKICWFTCPLFKGYSWMGLLPKRIPQFSVFCKPFPLPKFDKNSDNNLKELVAKTHADFLQHIRAEHKKYAPIYGYESDQELELISSQDALNVDNCKLFEEGRSVVAGVKNVI